MLAIWPWHAIATSIHDYRYLLMEEWAGILSGANPPSPTPVPPIPQSPLIATSNIPVLAVPAAQRQMSGVLKETLDILNNPDIRR